MVSCTNHPGELLVLKDSTNHTVLQRQSLYFAANVTPVPLGLYCISNYYYSIHTLRQASLSLFYECKKNKDSSGTCQYLKTLVSNVKDLVIWVQRATSVLFTSSSWSLISDHLLLANVTFWQWLIKQCNYRMARSLLLPVLLESHRQWDGGNCGLLDFLQLKPSGKSVRTSSVNWTYTSLTLELRALQSGKDHRKGTTTKAVWDTFCVKG